MNREKIREKIKLLRKSQTREEVNKKSKTIQEKLFSLPEFKNARTVAFYVAIKKNCEVETEQMIKDSLKMGKRILVPIADTTNKILIFSELRDYDKELEIGSFGILEPKREYRRIINPKEIDMIVVPGYAFDTRGYRFGYGFGYYDRFLTLLKKDIPKVGLVFEFQIVNTISNQQHDIPVDKIITEEKVIDCKK